MARTYRALALLLTYPTPDLQALAPEALALIETEALVKLARRPQTLAVLVVTFVFTILRDLTAGIGAGCLLSFVWWLAARRRTGPAATP